MTLPCSELSDILPGAGSVSNAWFFDAECMVTLVSNGWDAFLFSAAVHVGNYLARTGNGHIKKL